MGVGIEAAPLGANFDEGKDTARSSAQAMLLPQSRGDSGIAPALFTALADEFTAGFQLGLEGRIAGGGWRRFRHGASERIRRNSNAPLASRIRHSNALKWAANGIREAFESVTKSMPRFDILRLFPWRLF